jgi:hypothetical protein
VEDFLPTLQKRVPPEDERETHTQGKESRDCTSPKAAVFKNTRNNDFPTQTKKKKPKHTTEVQTQNFSFFF